MSTITKVFQIRFHAVGTTNPTDGTVDFSVQAEIATPVNLPGPDVRVLTGRTEARPWRFDVVDQDATFFAQWVNANSRLDLLGRILEVRVDENGAGYSTIGIGRVSDVRQKTPGTWTIGVEDERWVERNTDLWQTADTTIMLPYGMKGHLRPSLQPYHVGHVYNLFQVGFPASFRDGDRLKVSIATKVLNDIAVDAIGEDVVPNPIRNRNDGSGNFKHLRFRARNNGQDYEVVKFGASLTNELFTQSLEDAQEGLITFWLVAPLAGPQPEFGYFHFVGAEPSDSNPLHVGIEPVFPTEIPNYTTRRPFVLLKQLFDEIGLRYDSVALQALIDDPKYPDMTWRITASENTAEWLARNIYLPTLTMPFIDNLGRVKVRSIEVPQNLDHTTLVEFADADVVEPPTWDQGSNNLVNRILYKHHLFRSPAPGKVVGTPAAEELEITSHPPDTIDVEEKGTPREGDSAGDALTRTLDVSLAGLHDGFIIGWNPVGTLAETETIIDLWMDRHSNDLFQRFQDGPITGQIKTIVGIAQVPEGGDFIKVSASTFPDPVNTQLGGLRIVQVLTVDRQVDGYVFHYLDAGPALQPIAAPTTVSLVKSTTNPKHEVDVTVSGLPAGAVATVEISLTNDETWKPTFIEVADGETRTIGRLPSNTLVYARARSEIPDRISSAWTESTPVTTDPLTAPSALTATPLSGVHASATWTNGEAEYPIEVLLRAGSTPAPTSWNEQDRIAVLIPGDVSHEHRGLTVSTLYTWAVRHRDPYGGVSAVATDEFTTTSVVPVATRPAGMEILVG